MNLDWKGRLAIPKLPPSPSLLQRGWHLLYYLRLKILATIFRSAVDLSIIARRYVFRDEVAWERSYHRCTREYTIPSTTAPRSIKIRVWDPPEEFTKNGLRPVHVNLHGSGYVVRTFGTDSDFCERLTNELGIHVLDCDYAKAPEYPFPHAYNDVVDVVNHVFTQEQRYDLSNFTIGGFSAGSGLAATTSCTSPDVKGRPKALVLIYPPGNFSIPPGPPLKARKGSTSPHLSSFVIEVFNASVVQPPHYRADPRISPACNDPKDFPEKVCIITGGLDNIKTAGRYIADKLCEANVYCEEYDIPDVGHGWDKTAIDGTWEADRRDEAYKRVIEFLGRVYKSK